MLNKFHNAIRCGKCKELYSNCRMHLCPMDRITCQCGIDIMREHHTVHLKRICPEQKIKCKYANYGCKTILKRKDFPDHEKVEMAKHLRMVQNKCFSLSLQVQTNRMQIDALELRLATIERR